MELKRGSYRCGAYRKFTINDPKRRIIHKASVKDRLVHHAIHRVLYPLFDSTFVFNSYSCRNHKGTHKAFARLVQLTRRVSANMTRPCWVLKCDIKRFFDSIDHGVLKHLLAQKIFDSRLLGLLNLIIDSFHTLAGKGLPLGNLTSQLFVNIYMDSFDKFMGHQLEMKYYLRYADDFIILGNSPQESLKYLGSMKQFLAAKLSLEIHPRKIKLRNLRWGIDFVGYVALPHYCLPRRKTVERILNNVRRLSRKGQITDNTLASYIGFLKHAASRGKQQLIREIVSHQLLE